MTDATQARQDTVLVTTTYLELADRAALRAASLDDADVLVLEAHAMPVAFYRFLYALVGSAYQWTDRDAWSDAQLEAHLRQPGVCMLVAYVRGVPAGYIELVRDSEEPSTEIAYFGLAPQFHGRGLGKYLLSLGVQRAFDDGAGRVWLHTCSLDGPHALANYQARGFVPYKTTTGERRGRV
jgi:ribosomal protein S18 acetylase RimI-like enzyme